jgi:hypothetical protein
MDEDKKRGRAGRTVQLATRGDDASKNTTTAADFVAQTGGLHGQPLHAVQSGLDTDGAGGWGPDGLLARQRARTGRRYDGLQQVRTDARAAGSLSQAVGEATGDASSIFSDELAAVGGYYASRLAAARAGLAPRDVAAAIRAIQNEKIIATRAVLERWSAASRASTAKRQAARSAAAVRPVSGYQPS